MKKSKRDDLWNKLYMGHAGIVWGGSVWQIIHIFSHKSAQDITLLWIVCLLISEGIALPRAISSPYKVWKLCHAIGLGLIAVLLIGVVRYGLG